MDWKSLSWARNKDFVMSCVEWFYIKPERSFLLNAEMTMEALQEVLSSKIDTYKSINPYVRNDKFKKPYTGDLSKTGFRIKRKKQYLVRTYPNCRISGKVVSKSPNPSLVIKIQGLKGWYRAVYITFILFFQVMFFVAVTYGEEPYDFGYHLLICFSTVWVLGIINFGHNRLVHNLEKQFVEDVQEWFNE